MRYTQKKGLSLNGIFTRTKATSAYHRQYEDMQQNPTHYISQKLQKNA